MSLSSIENKPPGFLDTQADLVPFLWLWELIRQKSLEQLKNHLTCFRFTLSYLIKSVNVWRIKSYSPTPPPHTHTHTDKIYSAAKSKTTKWFEFPQSCWLALSSVDCLLRLSLCDWIKVIPNWLKPKWLIIFEVSC